jgi:hypothetical protein
MQDFLPRKSLLLIPVKDPSTDMPLAVLEVVNSNTGHFSMDNQYLANSVKDLAVHIINNKNSEMR